MEEAGNDHGLMTGLIWIDGGIDLEIEAEINHLLVLI